MKRMLMAAVASLTLISGAPAKADEAKDLAQQILDKGSALFDSRDAKAMAATFADSGEIVLYVEDPNSGEFKHEAQRGRAAIEEAYSKLFNDRSPGTKSKNTVEEARFLSPKILVIEGKFAYDTSNPEATVSFVQIRRREGDRWQVLTMQLFSVPK